VALLVEHSTTAVYINLHTSENVHTSGVKKCQQCIIRNVGQPAAQAYPGFYKNG